MNLKNVNLSMFNPSSVIKFVSFMDDDSISEMIDRLITKVSLIELIRLYEELCDISKSEQADPIYSFIEKQAYSFDELKAVYVEVYEKSNNYGKMRSLILRKISSVSVTLDEFEYVYLVTSIVELKNVMVGQMYSIAMRAYDNVAYLAKVYNYSLESPFCSGYIDLLIEGMKSAKLSLPKRLQLSVMMPNLKKHAESFIKEIADEIKSSGFEVKYFFNVLFEVSPIKDVDKDIITSLIEISGSDFENLKFVERAARFCIDDKQRFRVYLELRDAAKKPEDFIYIISVFAGVYDFPDDFFESYKKSLPSPEMWKQLYSLNISPNNPIAYSIKNSISYVLSSMDDINNIIESIDNNVYLFEAIFEAGICNLEDSDSLIELYGKLCEKTIHRAKGSFDRIKYNILTKIFTLYIEIDNQDFKKILELPLG